MDKDEPEKEEEMEEEPRDLPPVQVTDPLEAALTHYPAVIIEALK